MRLYNPILGIVKATSPNHSSTLSLDGGKRTITLPEGTPVIVNINAIHAHPLYWGDDALEWRPSRWIQTDGDGVERLLVPEKGVWEPWSEGIRVCPGRKFSQVEHLALMASILYSHAVEPARERGETPQQTRERIMAVVADSGMVLNVQMRHPEKARLVWKRL